MKIFDIVEKLENDKFLYHHTVINAKNKKEAIDAAGEKIGYFCRDDNSAESKAGRELAHKELVAREVSEKEYKEVMKKGMIWK